MISGKIYRFRVNPEVMDARFLEMFLLSSEAQARIDEMKTGISDSGLNLTKDRFLGLSVPVVPLDAQRRIVEILEDHLSRLDAAQRFLGDAEARFASLAESFLSSSPELAAASEVPLGSVLASPLANGRSVPTAEEGFPVLRLTSMKDGVIDLSERKIGRWTADEGSKFRVERGDVFVSRGNGSLNLVGRAARVVEEPDPVAFPDTMIRIRLDESRVRPDFLTLIWNARATRTQIERSARTTAGIYKVNQKDLQRVLVPVPALADQDRLVERVNVQMDASTRVRAEALNAQQRGQRLRRALLAAAFSGRLTGSSLDTERIEELVEAGV